MRRALPLIVGLGALFALPAGAQLQLEAPTGFVFEQIVYPPFAGPTIGFAFFPDERILIIEKNSPVQLVAKDASSGALIGMIPDVESEYIERGLLGVAVDPDWPTTPYVYFYYNHVDSTCYLTRFTTTGALQDPFSTNLHLEDPYHILTDVPDDQGLHQAGTLRFGPLDGMLYLSTGEDNDPCASQDLTNLGGNILRLDVSGLPSGPGGPPAKSLITPTDNPFPGPDENEQLVYAWGFRNPFRFTIDPFSGDLVIGDVGAMTWEEVNIVPASGGGGENFGWPVKEALDDFVCGASCDSCGLSNTFTDPAHFYMHNGSASVIGGPVYRTSGAPYSFPGEYDGNIFFYEHYEGVMRRLVNGPAGWEIAPPVAGQPSSQNWSTGLIWVSDLQQGPDGAIYMVNVFGFGTERGIFRIRPNGTTDAPVPASPSSPVVRVWPNPARASAGATVEWNLARRSRATLRILDPAGRVVRTLAKGDLAANGRAHWDGRRQDGRPAAAGVYFFRLDDEVGGVWGGRLTLIR